ncbi:hypothetical protein DPMN_137039 [Dreissena polymorpha]|uniref:Uncharacterized protein n=1 Tax=Dreissena polymorpha TaxID=45954 RepID=A0A9D4G716_DREPO|nr:hypothetical protein DPMN_137039 [Dreissena polymorpha]
MGHRRPTSSLQACRFSPAAFCNRLSIRIQVAAPGVSRPPFLLFPFGVPVQRFPCQIDLGLRRCGLFIANVSKG